ncbi:signal peptide peptidase SppA [Desulfocurvibacter africanus]|uniref:Signal peptide peptidase SppA, 36K type n=1 Tax=Desulfocurvibacter africanus subsp. africanus str. Walvis Bay TaxID=690850 RepID=F3YZ68_DESAF|nr:signal peptide peptidase SppA [Desulfocurvibacter africanus]EGJ50824.1 signal peptide peptidase SppA, 36K type [Desulfocurvibacter africanus subsp. africanus str. Walvis Bay]
MRSAYMLLFLLLASALSGCASVNLFRDYSEPLREFTLEGTAEPKVVLITVRGTLETGPDEETFREAPGIVQETVSQLDKAAADPSVKALVLAVDSPGGTATASDILYGELLAWKEKTKAKLVVCMLEVAASGGYYISLPADVIVAHPTTITGSVGTIFIRPKVVGLMDKIGVDVDVTKSGVNKDMGSPFRQPSREEVEMFDGIVGDMNSRFLSLVAKHRNLSDENMRQVSTARVFTANQARKVGLVDEIGNIDFAVATARKQAGLPENARLVVYRRTEYADDNPYNSLLTRMASQPTLVDLGAAGDLLRRRTGFYYLWEPGY